MTAAEKLRRLHVAADNITAVLENAPEATAELSEALNWVHSAETQIVEAQR